MTKIVEVVLLLSVAVICGAYDVYHPRPIKTERKQPLIAIEENESSFWKNKAQQKLFEKLQVERNVNKARNVILFLGDGMSIPTLTAARIYQNELSGGRAGEGSSLFFENFPFTGLSKTYCVDYTVADSACSATAYLTGVKGNEGTIGVNGKVIRGDCEAMRDSNNHAPSIAQWFQQAGRATGIVTTTRVTHASPAGAYAHVAERDWEDDNDVGDDNADTRLCDDIAEQLVYNEPGKNFNVIMGGGRRGFLPKDLEGHRKDGVNLIDAWALQKNQSAKVYTTTRAQLLMATDTTAPNYEYLLGLFDSSHMSYHLEGDSNQPTLSEMTRAAIKILQGTQRGSKEGFFLFVEGGKIDMGHHENHAHLALDETVEFAKAIETAKGMTNESDTLIVVTADHAHTMSLAGYSSRQDSILGVGGKADDKMPYSILSYANGPSFKIKDGKRHDISKDNMSDKDYEFPSAAPLGSETHGGDDVAVFASGPYAHLFTGSLEQNFLPHAMAYAACVGKGKTMCD